MIEVVVIGAGISGLTFAITASRFHNVKVTVFERAAAFQNVGNGLQIPCNAAHVMRCLGMLDKLRAKTKRSAASFKTLAYSDGKELVERNLTYYEKIYGAPWLLMHRADYMQVLLDKASQAGVVIKSGCEVRQVDFSAPSVTLTNGQIQKADLVVGSDGVHSKIRSLLHPSIQPVPTGEYAYRTLFTRSQLSTPALQHIASSPGDVRVWLGPMANAVLYPLQDGDIFNLVIVIADTEFNTTRKQGEDLLGSVKHWLRDWDPVLLQMLNKTDQLARYPLYQVQTLPSWSDGCVTLMGDAAHAMLPHLAQGAAAAVEDGFVLGTLLGRWAQAIKGASDPSLRRRQIRAIVQSYEKIQLERTTRIASNSRLTGVLEHLPSGPEQRARDAEFATFLPERAETCVSGMPWIDGRWNSELLGRKVDEETDCEFQRLVDGWRAQAQAMGRETPMARL